MQWVWNVAFANQVQSVYLCNVDQLGMQGLQDPVTRRIIIHLVFSFPVRNAGPGNKML